MANSTCHTSLDVCRLRIATLNNSGSPVSGALNGIVSDAPITVDVTIEVDAGDTETLKNGCGSLAFTYEAPDSIKGLTLATSLTEFDVELLRIMTGSSTIASGGNDIGMQAPAVGASPPVVCVEAWTKAWDVSTQKVPAFTSPNAAYMHWVFPYTTWVQDKFTLEHKLLVTPLKGKGKENTQITVNGPFDDWPAAVAAANGIRKLYGWFYDATLPAVTCAPIAVSSAAS